jgi:hypothetical protein
MTVFTKLPQDMLQHEIARFLDHRDILSFNEVLKNGERVYKKLPADYALNHHILIIKDAHTILANQSEAAHNEAHYSATAINLKPIKKLVYTTKKFFKFLGDPFNKPMFMYQKGIKESQMNIINYWLDGIKTDPDNNFYSLLSARQKKEIEDVGLAAAISINATPFVRSIKLSRLARAIF